MAELVKDNTSVRGNFKMPGEQHALSASTEPFVINTSVSNIARWYSGITKSDTCNRIANGPEIFVGHIATKGHHNQVQMILAPDSIRGIYTLVHSRSSLPSAMRDLIVASGTHRVITQPRHNVINERIFASRNEGVLGISYQGFVRIQGSSSFENITNNATVQDIENSSYPKDFIKHFGKSLTTLQSLSSLEKGWDSYNAKTVLPAAIRNTERFLYELHKIDVDISCPTIGPTPDGSIACQWFMPHIEILAEITPKCFSYYIARPEKDNVDEEDSFDSLPELARYIRSRLRPSHDF